MQPYISGEYSTQLRKIIHPSLLYFSSVKMLRERARAMITVNETLKNTHIHFAGTQVNNSDPLSSDILPEESEFKPFVAHHLDSAIKDPLVIFDVDDTALSNFDAMNKVNFSRLTRDLQHSPAIPEVLALYRKLKEMDYHCVFVSERTKDMHHQTESNLIAEGYFDFLTLITRDTPNESELLQLKESDRRCGDFKKCVRKQFEEQGYEIVATVGDQDSDFEGGSTGMIIRLPNYIYILH